MYIEKIFKTIILKMGSVKGHKGRCFLYFIPTGKMTTLVDCDKIYIIYNIITKMPTKINYTKR